MSFEKSAFISLLDDFNIILSLLREKIVILDIEQINRVCAPVHDRCRAGRDDPGVGEMPAAFLLRKYMPVTGI